ncbi:nucleoside hydrolase [Eremomyces bilateralis CBS 781.70]|uniref:Nucleoside hydrolase n=1 Tax=Eremomyces bilateralis CBS 781.70 TaxID=1392243 RepID=A0A6G1GHE2_9PEZI|nr:nucleoside hydrolase [Eremomyces bilateralis CBS 781.70]KAF1817356.1 nucleoside hydrolase [Eremomyces bilateralis CBS 781.70]
MARHRIIIDTDPGIDDILALLLALSASPEDLEVLLISLTYGNIDVENCLRNVVSLFHHVEKEREWRKSKGLPEGFDALDARKPIVAVGAVGPLAAQIILADYYHGIDGLGGIHHTHPHLSPEATWRHLFQSSQAADDDAIRDQNPPNLFIPSKRPAHEEILQILRDNPPDTITIVTIGPLTNAAHAAAVDPETFLRAKQVLTMGGAVELEGNMNPVAEFNIYADSIAAARVFALSSPKPLSTMPLVPPAKEAGVAEDPCLAAYPATLGRRLELKLFPLDITTTHNLTRQYWDKMMKQPLEDGSPLAHWMSAFLESTFRKAEELYHLRPEEVGLNLHDPLPIW